MTGLVILVEVPSQGWDGAPTNEMFPCPLILLCCYLQQSLVLETDDWISTEMFYAI